MTGLVSDFWNCRNCGETINCMIVVNLVENCPLKFKCLNMASSYIHELSKNDFLMITE